jgi:hypothetical protein
LTHIFQSFLFPYKNIFHGISLVRRGFAHPYQEGVKDLDRPYGVEL